MAKSKTPASIALELPPPAEPFPGFSPKTFVYLHALKKNNNKPWFDAHRTDFEDYLREPSKALVTVMGELFAEAGLPIGADHRRSLFRINRDIRFSTDKSPYKTHIGIVFPLESMAQDEWAGMYMSMEPKGRNEITSYIGGGAYSPSPLFLKSIREHIAKDHVEFEKLNNAKTFRKEFPNGITGEALTRMPKGFDETQPGAEFIKKKEFLYGTNLEKAELASPELPKILMRKIKAAMPMLKFLGGKQDEPV
jgi:uncharacterized protein (TIGR02453 family)